MNNFIIDDLPFYWRLSPSIGSCKNIVEDFYSFEFELNIKYGLLIQKRNTDVLSSLTKIYKENYNIGILQDVNLDNDIGKSYSKDFIDYLDKVLLKNSYINKILEVGCGDCIVLKKLMNKGYDVVGIDPGPLAYEAGVKKNIKVITDFFPSLLLNEKVDLIFHVDVLEHINNFEEFLSSQYDLLNENGVIIVNVPDASESFRIGDISLAMHEHLNYFTDDSLQNILESIGFRDVTVNKSSYGGSLYAIGYRNKKVMISKNPKKIDSYIKFTNYAIKNSNKFNKYITDILSDKNKTLGFYVPLRALPYISKSSFIKGFRFFDDTPHWHYKFFDGINVKIENFTDLKKDPVTDIIVMSLTFGKTIKNLVNNEFKGKVNVISLNDLIDH